MKPENRKDIQELMKMLDKSYSEIENHKELLQAAQEEYARQIGHINTLNTYIKHLESELLERLQEEHSQQYELEPSHA